MLRTILKMVLPLVPAVFVLCLILAMATTPNKTAQPTSVSQNQGYSQYINYWHDANRHVSCWIFDAGARGNGISCLPDSQVGGISNP
jgi:hypothetical protein